MMLTLQKDHCDLCFKNRLKKQARGSGKWKQKTSKKAIAVIQVRSVWVYSGSCGRCVKRLDCDYMINV